MLPSDDLTLRFIRLKSGDSWSQKREALHFLLIQSGAGKCVTGQVTRVLGRGDVLVLNRVNDGIVTSGNGQELAFCSFSVCMEHLFPLFSVEEITLLEAISDRLKAARCYMASTAVATCCHALVADMPPVWDLEHRSQLLRIAAAVLSEEFKRTHHRSSGAARIDEHLLQVFDKLTADELLTLSVVELAARFGCSRRHLNRIFHQHFGFSVAALRMELRLLKAISLLRNHESKIINVAGACGFNHLGLFNICFRKRFGCSPGQWRKRVSPAAEPEPRNAETGTRCPMSANGLCPWGGPENSYRLFQPALVPKQTAQLPHLTVASPAGLGAPTHDF